MATAAHGMHQITDFLPSLTYSSFQVIATLIQSDNGIPSSSATPKSGYSNDGQCDLAQARPPCLTTHTLLSQPLKHMQHVAILTWVSLVLCCRDRHLSLS